MSIDICSGDAEQNDNIDAPEFQCKGNITFGLPLRHLIKAINFKPDEDGCIEFEMIMKSREQ